MRDTDQMNVAAAENGRRLSFRMSDPLKPGAVLMREGIHFCCAPRNPDGTVLVVTDDEGTPLLRVPMSMGAKAGAWRAVFVCADEPALLRYYYEENGFPVPDPYAGEYSGGLNGPTKEEAEDATAASPLRDLGDLVLYKLHVRGFTMKDGSVPASHRGTFAGVIDKIPYLRALGISGVELMPVYTFPRNLPSGRINYWGYGTGNLYFAPNALYVRGKRPQDAQEETAAMFRSLREAGICVILDFFLDPGVPRQQLLQALHYWKIRFGADGFRLYGDADIQKEILMDPFLADCVLIAEDGDRVLAGDYFFSAFDRVLTPQRRFTVSVRRLLLGDGQAAAALAESYRGAPAGCRFINAVCDHNGFTLRDLVSYNERHNEKNGENNADGPWENDSWNCGAEGETKKRSVRALRVRQAKNALALTLLGQGIPMILSGDECGNTQAGNNNGYLLDDPDGWIVRAAKGSAWDLTEFTKELLAFRRRHPVLFAGRQLKGADFLSTGLPDVSFHSSRLFRRDAEKPALAVLFNERYTGEREGVVLILINECAQPYRFALPPYLEDFALYAAVRTDGKAPAYEEESETKDGDALCITLPGRSVRVYEGERKCR